MIEVVYVTFDKSPLILVKCAFKFTYNEADDVFWIVDIIFSVVTLEMNNNIADWFYHIVALRIL